MGQVFDEADYRRKLDALDSSNIGIGEEAGLIAEGWAKGSGSGPLDAKKNVLAAKQRGLRDTRKKMIKAIRAEEEKMRQNDLLPVEVEQIVTGQSDMLVKV
jgi:hypothetical protein